jgi:hypothetical protein
MSIRFYSTPIESNLAWFDSIDKFDRLAATLQILAICKWNISAIGLLEILHQRDGQSLYVLLPQRYSQVHRVLKEM